VWSGVRQNPLVEDGCNKVMPSSLQTIEFTTLFGSEDNIL
jgi:hypothetical protein